MHIRCQYTDETRKELDFCISSENTKEENELNLLWALLNQKELKYIDKFLNPTNMSGIKFTFKNAPKNS